MNIDEFSLEDLLLAAIKSEMDSERVYLELSKNIKNPFLKGRLEFLANEEKKHKAFLQNIFKKTFPDKSIIPPSESVVPMPEIRLYGESGAMRDVVLVLEDAMKAEKAAQEFYASLMDRFEDEKLKKILRYLSVMEGDHYEILKKERDELEEVESVMEDYDYMQLDGMG